MPSPQQPAVVFPNDGCKPSEFARAKTAAILESQRRQPELGDLRFTFNVNVRRFVPITGVKEKPIRPTSQDGRRHPERLCQLLKKLATASIESPADGTGLTCDGQSSFEAIQLVRRAPPKNRICVSA
jgi:hypothetical protein